MSPALGGWAGSETPPPGGTQPNPTRPDPPPAQTLAVPWEGVADHEHLAEPESPPPYGQESRWALSVVPTPGPQAP